MLGLFQAAVSEGTVSSTAELKSLQTLAANPTFLMMPASVANLASKVSGSDPANATYQSLNSLGVEQSVSLGNLKVGSSATQLQELVNKWFLGMDDPTAGAAYSVVTGTLFGTGGPSYADVFQGDLGDCTVMASLAEVAARMPSVIQSMFTFDGTNVVNGATVSVWTVRFYHNGTPTYVTVDNELPASGELYDQPNNGVLWVALAEKAYAEVNQEGWLGTLSQGVDSYLALNNGDSATIVAALSAVTGLSSSRVSTSLPTTWARPWHWASSSCWPQATRSPTPTSSTTTLTPSSATLPRRSCLTPSSIRGASTAATMVPSSNGAYSQPTERLWWRTSPSESRPGRRPQSRLQLRQTLARWLSSIRICRPTHRVKWEHPPRRLRRFRRSRHRPQRSTLTLQV